MQAEKRFERAADHIQKAQGCLAEMEERHPSFASSVQDHLAAALAEVSTARESNRVPVGRRGISELASGVMGLLSILLHRMNETSGRLKPLQPGRETIPLRRLRKTDLNPVVEGLRDLRRLTGRLEAELRLLNAKMDADGRQAS